MHGRVSILISSASRRGEKLPPELPSGLGSCSRSLTSRASAIRSPRSAVR